MSDFVQQQNSICDFATSDSWVILSPIEQRMLLSFQQRSAMKSLPIVKTQMNVRERRNLFDRFLEAAILRGMDMTGQICF